MNRNSNLVRRILLPFVLAASLGGAAAAVHAAAPTAQLQTLVTARQIDFTTVEPLYRSTLKRDGAIDEVIAQLQTMSKETARPKRERANALLVASHLQWQFGLRPAAQASVEEALKIDTSADLAMQQGRLLEASGELQQARKWYEQAFNLYTDPKHKEQVRLRLTFVSVGQQNVDALVRLAQNRDRDFRNRAAVALAVLNRYDEAAGLYQVYGDESNRFRQHLRLAQWALEAGDARSSQDEAWKAVQIASLDRDQRYALSVLVDAHEKDNSLDRLLKRFEQKGRLSADEQDIRIDLLQKLRRYDEAIRLFKEDGRTDITPASRRQLLRMYSEAGHTTEMVAEYRKLIAAEPDQPAWTEGLAQHLMEQSDRPAAAQAWRSFIDGTNHPGALLGGAAAMARFGFDDLAMAAADKVVKVEPSAASEALLFRFELDVRRGRTADAQAVLALMDRTLPADSQDRVEMADAYERIKQPGEALRILEALDQSRAGGLGMDERMRTAWLYDSTGQRDKALGVWKGLWEGQVTDAFRRLVEDRLVTLAAETGTLGDLAVELETKLADGTATKKDSGLLIRIYTDTNDSASAVEVIREYFRSAGRSENDLESLREQANVYRALGRFEAFKRITTQLVDIDEEGKVDHLQSLVLNQLENGGEPSKEKTEQLQKWLGQLRGTGGAAAGAEFEAGILVLAGQEEQAIQIYRKALAENPEHSDNYLLLADLLKKRSKEAEAIAALQYLVETADRDDAFIVGVDGILNMRPRDKWVIEWAQRRALERLTARDDKLYLYDLLGELAEGAGNTEMYFSALENSLAYANSRRSNVLRELISASAEKSPMNAMMGVGNAGKPDAERNLRYSRRLVSLGEELPPEVYTDMGRQFLKKGDPENAADAFNRAVDRTGDGALVEQTGDMFSAEGFIRQAGMQYEKALIADADNAGIMRKLAEIRSRQGATQEAEDLYMRALMNVLQALPQEIEKVGQSAPPAFDTTVSYEYRENYISLLTGFLYTLPEGQDRFAAVGKSFDEVLGEAMRNVNGAAPKEIAWYPRLNAYSRFLREAALRSGRYDLADSLDGKLLRYFGGDSMLVTELVKQRREWGLPASAVRLAAQAQGAAAARVADKDAAGGSGIEAVLPSRAAAQQALARLDYPLAIRLALYNKDQALALSAYREWARGAITAEAPATQDPMALFMGNQGGDISTIITDARNRLDAATFSSFARYVVDLVQGREEYQRKLLSMNPYFFGGGGESTLLVLEKAAGRSIMTEAELGEFMAAGAGGSSPQQQRRNVFDLNYLKSRLSGGALVDLVERNISKVDMDNPGGIMVAMPAFGAALSKPLTPQQSTRLITAFKTGVQKQMSAGSFNIMNIVNHLQRGGISRTVLPANAPLLEEVDTFLATTYPKVFAAGTLKVDGLIGAGRVEEALPLLVNAILSGRDPGAAGRAALMAMAPMAGRAQEPDVSAAATQVLRPYASAIFPRHQPALLAQAQAKEQELGLTPPVFGLLLAIQTLDPQNTPGRQLKWVESVAARHPDKEFVLQTLSREYAGAGLIDHQVKTLQQLVTLAPRKNEYRRQLFQLWKQLGNPIEAVAATGGKIAEISQDPAAGNAQQRAMRAAMRAGNDPMLRPATARPIEQIMALENGGNEEQARLALRSILQQLPPAGASWSEMRAMMGGGGDAVQPLQYSALFNLDWRRPEPPRPEQAEDTEEDDFFAMMTGMGSGRGAPAAPSIESMTREEEVRDAFSRQGKFLDKLTDYAFSIDEFEAQIRTLRPQDIDTQYLLYSLLADAYAKHGRLESELARLTALIESGEAGGKERVLWLEILRRVPQSEAAARLPLVEKAVEAAGMVKGQEQVLLARVLAHAGDEARASDIYGAAVLGAMSGGGSRQMGFYGMGDQAQGNAATLYVDATQHLTPAGLERFAQLLLTIVQPQNDVQAASGLYEQFVMWMLNRTPQLQVAQSRFQTLTRSATATEQWSSDTLLQAAQLLARQGEYDTALKLVKQTLRTRNLREPGFDPFGVTNDEAQQQEQQRQQVIEQYRSALGLDVSTSSMYGGGGGVMIAVRIGGGRGARTGAVNVMAYKPVFPAKADAWSGAQEWNARAAAQVAEWIGQGEADRELGLQVLALVTLRLHQMGAEQARLDAVRNMTRLLQPYEAVPQQMATLAVATMEHVQAPIDPDMLRGLIQARRIDVRLLGPALRRVAATHGAAQALELGQLASAYTQEPNMLQTLKALAGDAQKPELVQVYIDLERRSMQAQEALARGSEVQGAAAAAEALEAEGEAGGAGPAIGDSMELKFTAVDGRAVDLAALKGKVVLVDFWATWCGPCIAELPNLKRVYENFHAKGFEVIGISLDRANDEEKLKEFVAKNNMPWPQHFDGKYWKNEFAVKNGVNAIPAAWLFDQNGKLVTKSGRGKKLEEEVEKLLGTTTAAK